ncbi:MAG: hypothetical protein V7638_3860 [Acidobacteriota bacterium]|jgi:hypothetical protein
MCGSDMSDLMLDYRNLLRKYIEHVQDCEGIDFIEFGQPPGATVRFTDAEWRELQQLTKEVEKIRDAERAS